MTAKLGLALARGIGRRGACRGISVGPEKLYRELLAGPLRPRHAVRRLQARDSRWPRVADWCTDWGSLALKGKERHFSLNTPSHRYGGKPRFEMSGRLQRKPLHVDLDDRQETNVSASRLCLVPARCSGAGTRSTNEGNHHSPICAPLVDAMQNRPCRLS